MSTSSERAELARLDNLTQFSELGGAFIHESQAERGRTAYLDFFANLITDDHLELTERVVRAGAVSDVNFVREELLRGSTNASISLDVNRWFDAQTLRVNLLKSIEDDVETGLRDLNATAKSRLGTERAWWIARASMTGLIAIALGTATVLAWRDRRRQAELEVRKLRTQRQEHLGLMAAGTAHDFNNMLMVINGNAALARKAAESGSGPEPFLAEIEATVERAAELTKQLRAYAGMADGAWETVDLSRVAEDTCLMLRLGSETGPNIVTDCKTIAATIEGDATQIRQVVLNLLTNAIDACGDSGGEIVVSSGVQTLTGDDLRTKVLVSAEALSGTFSYIEVLDQGCGIPLDLQERIFEPYFSSNQTGLGLGLATVAGVIRSHAGALSIWSEVGHGTSIRSLFPQVTEQTTERSKQAT